MAIQGAPRRLRGQNPNAPQIPTFSPNDFGGQLGNMQIGNMGGLMGSQPRQPTYLGTPPPQDDNQLLPVRNTALPNPSLNNNQVQGNMGGGGLMGGAAASNSPYANSAFSDMPVKPRFSTQDMVQWTDPITGQQRAGGSSDKNYNTSLKSYFDNNAGAQDYYNQLNPPKQPPMAGNMGGMGGGGLLDGLGGLVNNVNNNQVQGNTGGGGLLGGAFDNVLGQLPQESAQVPIDYSQNILGGGGYIGVMGGFDDFGNIMGSGAANDAREQYYRNTGQPTNNGVNNMANPYTTDVLTGPAASTSGPSDTMAYGGALLGGLLGGDVSGALQAAGGYYAGQQGIEGAMATGQAGLGLGEAMGKRAYDQSQFRPFGVTSNLANVQTTPEGGVNLNLSPEQQAMQQQLLGQSRGLFGQVGADPAAAQSALYEQIRATQQPEEERQRLQMQENLFSSGRGGVQTAMYGGTPEQMAYEKARQESMLNANLAARTQSQAEQLQAANLGGMLQQAGYDPQRQAIDLFGASGVPSQLAAKGQLGGAELQAQAGGRGLESYMQGANMANLLQQQQLQGLMTGAVGKPLTAQEQLMNAMIGRLGGTPIEAGGGMLGGVLDWGKELLGFGEDKPNFTLNPSEIDKLSDAEKEQALYDLFN